MGNGEGGGGEGRNACICVDGSFDYNDKFPSYDWGAYCGVGQCS